jgi:hypothetical protein
MLQLRRFEQIFAANGRRFGGLCESSASLSHVDTRSYTFTCCKAVMGKKRKRRVIGRPGSESIAARKKGLVITTLRGNAIARLLDTAIWLWFEDRDPLSIHVLVCAAYECLDALGKKSGKGPVLKEYLGADQFTTAYDFLRHSSSNPHVELDFPPSINAPILFDAVVAFDSIFGTLSLFMRTFRAYFTVKPEPYVSEVARNSAQEFLPDGVTVQEVKDLSAPEFFAKITEIFALQYAAVRRDSESND